MASIPTNRRIPDACTRIDKEYGCRYTMTTDVRVGCIPVHISVFLTNTCVLISRVRTLMLPRPTALPMSVCLCVSVLGCNHGVLQPWPFKVGSEDGPSAQVDSLRR